MTGDGNQDEYAIIYPRQVLPGCLVVAAKVSSQSKIDKLQKNREKRRYIVRAFISDRIPLSGGIEDVISQPPFHLLGVKEKPLTIYLHHGGKRAVFQDLHPDDFGRLKYIDVEVETDLPSRAFAPARTEINALLDVFRKFSWMPLVISRLDLFVYGDDDPLCHELLLPFNEGVMLGPMGGMHQFPLFASYDSLIREAISTTSPYYRFLCAYRLYEGINPLRRDLKKLAEKHSVVESLPKDIPVDLELLKRMGFIDGLLEGVKTTSDLSKKLTEYRDRVAHFLLDRDPRPIDFSNGFLYSQYALAGSVLLHYSHQSLVVLTQYFGKHLNDKLTRGSILPIKEQRDQFIIKAEDY